MVLQFRIGTVLTVLAAVVLVGCSGIQGDEQPSLPSTPTPITSESPAPAGPSQPGEDRTTIGRNDFAKGPVEHTFGAGGMTVTVRYATRLDIADWTQSAAKPISVSLTSISKDRPGQKIYLTRVTNTVTARDTSGPLDSPRALVDTANISPGFLVTFPYTYGQSFVVPALDEGAESVTLDFTYEFLLQVGTEKDYYKQTATDTLVVPIAS